VIKHQTVIGVGSKAQLTPPSNARVGDRVIMTKGPAIEVAGIAIEIARRYRQRTQG